jgi:hypothetical protein
MSSGRVVTTMAARFHGRHIWLVRDENLIRAPDATEIRYFSDRL